MGKIYILEGCDGTGKSTLAESLMKAIDGNMLHQTYDKHFLMETYLDDVMESAVTLCQYRPIVLDRWVPSEAVYAKVFRGGAGFDTDDLIEHWLDEPGIELIWIFCRNDNAVENHSRLKRSRKEMFDDVSKVAKEYDRYIKKSSLPWVTYDYDKVDINKFIEEVTQ